MNTSIAILASFIIILLTGTVWIIFRIYSKHLSRVNEELQDIKGMLNELPINTSLEEYMFAQDQRLRSIKEELDLRPDADVLHQYIKDQANQIIAVISTHDEDRQSLITREFLENTSKEINKLLDRVLWSLRFDEDKYIESTESNKTHSASKVEMIVGQSNTHAKKFNQHDDGSESREPILNGSDDSYTAMLENMKQSGMCGIEALRALERSKACSYS